MPCRQCDNGKWQWGSGPCTYDSKADCERANSESLAPTVLQRLIDEMDSVLGDPDARLQATLTSATKTLLRETRDSVQEDVRVSEAIAAEVRAEAESGALFWGCVRTLARTIGELPVRVFRKRKGDASRAI